MGYWGDLKDDDEGMAPVAAAPQPREKARAEMVRTLGFCEPCGALLGIYRHRGSFAGVVHALLLIKDCPSCGPQLRDEQPQYSGEEFATYVVAWAAQTRKEK